MCCFTDWGKRVDALRFLAYYVRSGICQSFSDVTQKRAPKLAFVSAATVRVGYFMPLSAALGLASVFPFRVAGPRLWAGSPSWTVPFGVSRCFYTYFHHCVSL